MKKMKIKTTRIFSFLVAIIIVTFLVPYKCTDNTIYKTDTICYTKTDTVYDTLRMVKAMPQIMVIETLKKDTVTDTKGNTFELITEEKKYLDTLVCDNDTAIINATVTGINASLDTIGLELRKSSYIKTNTIEINNYIKHKKIRISPQIGLGYGMTTKSFDVYVGIGLSINI